MQNAVFAALVAACAAGARAEPGRWLHRVLTDDGDAVVEPGETATIRFSIDYEPSLGSIDPSTGFEVYGFGEVWCNFTGIRNWATGFVGWHADPQLIWISGDLTAKDESTQSLSGTYLAQNPGAFGGFWRIDPYPSVMDIYWDPKGDYSPRHVELLADAVDDKVGLWLDIGPWQEQYVFPFADGLVAFDVVPAPGATSVGLAMVVWACTRRGLRREHA